MGNIGCEAQRPVEKRQGTVNESVGHLEDSVTEINRKVDSLFEKIEDILSPNICPASPTNGCITEQRPLPNLVNRLEDLNQYQGRVINKLNELLNRIEL